MAGPSEQLLASQYSALCTELGDKQTQLRVLTRRIAEIETALDRLNASLPLVQEMDRRLEAAKPPDPAP